jgi:lysophospholipase L1-like esterase
MLRTFTFLLFITGLTHLNAQCGQDYGAQIQEILANSKAVKSRQPRLVLAGSSTFRLWTNAGMHFTDYTVVNAGIGGSCFSDLWEFRQQLLVDTRPDVLAIYEGDNDLAAGQSIEVIVQKAGALISWFQERTNYDVPIVLVAPKPSPLRIALAADYHVLNDRLKAVCSVKNVGFVDTWPALCSEEGLPNPEFFQADQLHLNDQGNAALAEAMKVEVDRLHSLYRLEAEHLRRQKRVRRSGAALIATHTLMAAHGAVIFREPYTWQGLDQAVWLAIHTPGVVATEFMYWLRLGQLRRFERRLKEAC